MPRYCIAKSHKIARGYGLLQVWAVYDTQEKKFAEPSSNASDKPAARKRAEEMNKQEQK